MRSEDVAMTAGGFFRSPIDRAPPVAMKPKCWLVSGKLMTALFLFFVAGGPRLAATTLDIPVFSGGYGIAFYEETARRFEAEHPGVVVKLYGDPRIEDKIRVRIIDGNLPDAALSGQLLWPALIRAGKVLDLTPFLAGPNWERDARWGDTFQPGALDGWRVGGRVYGVPLTYACWNIFYNKALFRAHGWKEPHTWDEFFQLCEKIRAAGIAPISLPGTRWLYANAFLRAASYNLAGPDAWNARNELAPGSWSNARYVRSAAVLQRIAENYTLRGWEGETHTGAQQALFQGRAAMTVSGSWLINETRGKTPAGFEWGTMNFPVFPDGAASPTAIQTGSDHFLVFATGDRQREQLTVDFLRFLTSRARATAFVRQVDAPVAVRGVPIETYSQVMQDTARIIDRAQAAFNMPQTMLQPPAIRQALIDGQMKLMLGEITPEQFAERIEAAAAADRARVADPDRVEMRHPIAGVSLLAALGAIALWLLRRRRVGAADASRSDAEPNLAGRLPAELRPRENTRPGLASASYFGRLRAGMATGFVGPALLLYGGLVLAPGLTAFAWAFTRWDGLSARTWAGFFNFKWLLFESDLFWSALRNNFFLMIVPAAIVLPLALFFAFLLHRGVWGASVFRGVFLFPNLLGGIAATLLWLSAYEPHGGLVNAGLVALGNAFDSDWLRGFDGHPWLAQSHLYGSLVPIYLWMACGFNLILFLAAMEGIDPQLYEAAEIDGASGARKFFTVTLPMIWEVFVIAAVFLVISGLNAFEMIWLLTSQDPDSATHTLGTLMVTSMFKEFQIGRAAAIAVVLVLLVAAGSAGLLRALKREDVES
jgi:raffinose/stachyose/melibiose transport system permease protein